MTKCIIPQFYWNEWLTILNIQFNIYYLFDEFIAERIIRIPFANPRKCYFAAESKRKISQKGKSRSSPLQFSDEAHEKERILQKMEAQNSIGNLRLE